MTPIVSATILRTQTDARLMALTRQGHNRAFETIVERYRKPIFRYCRRFVPESRAEDALQQVFLNAWAAIRDGTEVADLRRWLYRIARNAALDAANKAGYDYEEFTEALRLSPAPENEFERRWVMRRTLAGLAALPARQRQALLRTAVHGESQAQIARDLNVSERAVGQLVHRARAAMRAAATALTPAPLVNWAVELGGRQTAVADSIRDLATGAGAAGGAGISLKAGSVVAVAGLLALSSGGAPHHASTRPRASTGTAGLHLHRAAAKLRSDRGALAPRRERRPTGASHRYESAVGSSELGATSGSVVHARSLDVTPNPPRDVSSSIRASQGAGGGPDSNGSTDPGSGSDSNDASSSDSSDSADRSSDSGDSGSGDSGSQSGDSGSTSGDSGSSG